MKKRKEELDIILPTMRGKSNDCFGFCIKCPQVGVEYQAKENKDLFYYACGLPIVHQVRFKK